jgi:hypothetical protein
MSGSVWVKVHPSQAGGPVEGAPPAPVLTNPEGGSVIKFTSGGDGDAGPTLAYGATITPDATVVVDQDNLEVAVSGTTPDTDYVVEVFGMNVAGRGEGAKTAAFQLNYNEAAGGTETIEDNYNGTNEKWKVHTFTVGGDTTLTVDSAINPFHVLVAGGGGNGGGTGSQGWQSGGGGGGAVYENESADLSGQATYSVTVGSNGNPGGPSILETFPQQNGGLIGSNSTTTTAAGGASGNGNAGAPTGNNGAGGGTTGNYTVAPNGLFSTITGETVLYGAGRADGFTKEPNTGCGGNATGGGNQPGNPGEKGVVIVAYQIGTSTTREIAQAQAEAAAREAGYATGYDVGVTDGREQAVEEARAMAASTLEVSE